MKEGFQQLVDSVIDKDRTMKTDPIMIAGSPDLEIDFEKSDKGLKKNHRIYKGTIGRENFH
jgi:hypothetical protein